MLLVVHNFIFKRNTKLNVTNEYSVIIQLFTFIAEYTKTKITSFE